MRTEENPLDLNNFPEDGKQTTEDSSMSAVTGSYRKKKNGAKDDGKVYECRFCSLKFCKSQALGGHMNRHRQERETETLNKARHLVFTNDLAPPHLGYVSSGQTINPHGGYHQAGEMADPSLPFRTSMYPTRLFRASSPPPPAASYMYTSPQGIFSSTQYPPPPSANDYFSWDMFPPQMKVTTPALVPQWDTRSQMVVEALKEQLVEKCRCCKIKRRDSIRAGGR